MPINIKISHYKSIVDLEMELGDVTVFIGENGCGKSNILEAIAIASAASMNKLDNEFLFSRGIRVTDPKLMTSAFSEENDKENIKVVFNNTPIEIYYDEEKNKWRNSLGNTLNELLINSLKPYKQKSVNSSQNWNIEDKSLNTVDYDWFIKNHTKSLIEDLLEIKNKILPQEFNFLIYSPEFFFLRNFESEGQIQPFGIKGEGVYKYLKALIQEKKFVKLDEIKSYLDVFDWFDDIVIDNGKTFTDDYTFKLKDRYLYDEFDHKSTNEGFLFVLFYICIIVHENTPSLIAIENIEASLNPKLCTELMQLLIKLSQKYNKKMILTTHNPAVLDGIDLKDDNQRLFRIHRNKSGHTRAFHIKDKSSLMEGKQIKLSEAFMRGYLGGLPTNF